MSPTAAMNAAAVLTLTPGMVINRRISGDLSAWRESSASSARSSPSRKVDLAQAPVQREALVQRQRQAHKPLAALLAEAVGDRRAAAEVARRHGMRLVLRAGPGPDQRVA